MSTLATLLERITDNKITRAISHAIGYRRYLRTHDEKALEYALLTKKEIRVAFLLGSLTAWKTENLYLAMVSSPRFTPLIAITPNFDDADADGLRRYLRAKGYEFVELGFKDKKVWQDMAADIVLYQKPYSYFVERGCFAYWRNADKLSAYVPYAFNTEIVSWSLDSPLFRDAWKVFFENPMCAAEAAKAMRNGGRNIAITGLPVQDELMTPAAERPDPWKQLPHPAKRIIYAPHHSIENDGGLNFSTFLTLGEPMLAIAKRYADRAQFAFKPHPLLRAKIEKIWGAERTAAYYREWETLPNCQFENGKYDGLFAHSDAMIHDCSSFTIEYHYTRRPVLYLVKESRHSATANSFCRMAYDLHYKAATEAEIEHFIESVVLGGDDPLRPARDKFYSEQLVPPGGQTACENIMTVLGAQSTVLSAQFTVNS